MNKFCAKTAVYISIFLIIILSDISSGTAISGRMVRRAGSDQAALTFDDGPKEAYTEEVLAVLKEKGVKATFFLLGIDVLRRPEEVKRIAAEGHVIANHSMTHENLKKMTFDEIRFELSDCSNLIEPITGKRPTFMRPPGGQYNAAVLKACDMEELVPVFWTNNPGDYSEKWKTADALSGQVIKSRRKGDIILLHLGLPLTAEALPRIIDSYRKAGYKFVTVEEIK